MFSAQPPTSHDMTRRAARTESQPVAPAAPSSVLPRPQNHELFHSGEEMDLEWRVSDPPGNHDSAVDVSMNNDESILAHVASLDYVVVVVWFLVFVSVRLFLNDRLVQFLVGLRLVHGCGVY